MKFKTVVGIDEVGRGPIAGPVAVCALCLQNDFGIENFRPLVRLRTKKLRDSKKLSHKQRLVWLEKINEERDKGNIVYKVSFESNKIIDTKGIVFAITRALENSLDFLNKNKNDCEVLLDGGLKAPVEYKNQKTIIKGDEKELAIALASIVAKVTRDDLMVKLARKYTGYGLEKHKGYGTAEHYKALNNKGISVIHRKSFLRKLTVVK
jgi:ribonuclease HII